MPGHASACAPGLAAMDHSVPSVHGAAPLAPSDGAALVGEMAGARVTKPGHKARLYPEHVAMGALVVAAWVASAWRLLG